MFGSRYSRQISWRRPWQGECFGPTLDGSELGRFGASIEDLSLSRWMHAWSRLIDHGVEGIEMILHDLGSTREYFRKECTISQKRADYELLSKI